MKVFLGRQLRKWQKQKQVKDCTEARLKEEEVTSVFEGAKDAR